MEVNIKRHGANLGSFAKQWYVSRGWSKSTGERHAYLKSDGTWHQSMRISETGNDGGTYFKTREECVAICQKFNIEVTEEKSDEATD